MALVQPEYLRRTALRPAVMQTLMAYALFALSFGFAVALICGLVR